MTTEILEKEIIPQADTTLAEKKSSAETVLAQALVKQTTDLTITTVEEAEAASKLFVSVSDRVKVVEAQRVELKAPHLEGGRKVDEFFRPALTALDSAKKILNTKLTTWNAEQRRKAEEEQRRLEAEAKAKADEEAKRIAEEEALAKAAELEAAGDTEGAMAAIDEVPEIAKTVYVPPVVPVVVKPAMAGQSLGLSGTTRWSFELTDMRKFVEACLSGTGGAHLGMLKVDEASVNALARSQKENWNVPGGKAVSNTTLSSRGGR